MKRLCLCALLSLMALPVFGATYQFEDAKLSYDVPDEWKQGKAEDMTVFNAPEGGMYLETYSVEKADLNAAIDDAVDGISKTVKDAKITREPEKIELNGLNAVVLEGTGTCKDDHVKWVLCIVGAKEPVFFLGIVEEGTFDAKKDEFLQVFHSIKAE